MTTSRLLAPLTWLALIPAIAPAADLATIDRTIAKEPAYKTKPKYCLLAFGPAAEHRVWLALDGATLYVDRNGNGDLTDPGETVTAEKSEGIPEGDYLFNAGDIRAGDRVHKLSRVCIYKLDRLAEVDDDIKVFHAQHPQARGYSIIAEIDLPGLKGTGIGGRVLQRVTSADVRGVLQFADSPRDAPVIHFGSREWQVTLSGRHALTRSRQTDMILGVGTPGVGPGTTAFLDYGGVIPAGAYPTVEVTYPPKEPGEPPVRERYELKQRC